MFIEPVEIEKNSVSRIRSRGTEYSYKVLRCRQDALATGPAVRALAVSTSSVNGSDAPGSAADAGTEAARAVFSALSTFGSVSRMRAAPEASC